MYNYKIWHLEAKKTGFNLMNEYEKMYLFESGG